MEELFKDLLAIIFKLFWANCWLISSRTAKKEGVGSFYFLMFIVYIAWTVVDVYFRFYK